MRCIISLANNRGNYQKALNRLKESVQGIDMFDFRNEGEVGAPPHEDNPYAFKVYAFKRVIALGYTSILWLDSSVVVRGDINKAFDHIEKEGYLMQESGYYVSEWCNDRTLRFFGLSRKDASKMLMYGNAGLLGLNVNNHTAKSFLDNWEYAMREGQFIGSWSNHRHDMTCGSIIANQLGMQYQSGNEWLQYSPPDAPLNNEKIIFSAQGM